MDASLAGKWVYKAGTVGTVTVPIGAAILQLRAHASGAATVSIFGGDAVPIISGESAFILRFSHLLATSSNASQAIVFTGTDSYLVEYVQVGF